MKFSCCVLHSHINNWIQTKKISYRVSYVFIADIACFFVTLTFKNGYKQKQYHIDYFILQLAVQHTEKAENFIRTLSITITFIPS